MLRGLFMFFSLIFSFSVIAKDTELKFYRPFVEGSQPNIKKKIQGECSQQSQRIKREDAWRCEAQGKIYDPCFIEPHGSRTEAVCPDSPWTADGLSISLSTPADNSQHKALDMSEAFPWAVELTTGAKCQAVDEGQVYDGLQVHYLCDTQAMLIGHVQRCETTWSILQRTASGVSTAAILRAWF